MKVANIKLALSYNAKQVVYHGTTVTVRKETVAIAADHDGKVWAYHEEQPEVCRDHFSVGEKCAGCEYLPYLEARFEHPDDWKDSLVVYALEEQS